MLCKCYIIDNIALTFTLANLDMKNKDILAWIGDEGRLKVLTVRLGSFFLQILCDLLSPAGESVKVGLRETAYNTSPHLSGKSHLAGDVPTRNHVHKQHQGRAASAHNHPDNQEVQQHRMIAPSKQAVHFVAFIVMCFREPGFTFQCVSLPRPLRSAGKAWSVTALAELTRCECTAPPAVTRD